MTTIPDAQLRRALRVHGDLTPEALAKVKRLEWDEYNAESDRTWKPISDLQGLEACSALEHVGLVGNHVRQLEPLAELAQLVEIWLTNNGPFTNLVPLANKGLRVLELRSTGAIDIAPLGGLTTLRVLGLESNRITSAAPLRELRWLTRLDLDLNQIGDVEPLRDLVNLEQLGLQGNPIVDVSPLGKLANVRELDLRNTQVEDLRPIADLPALKDLRIDGAPAAKLATDVLESLRARGVRIDNVGRLGAGATWTVTPVALKAFRPRD